MSKHINPYNTETSLVVEIIHLIHPHLEVVFTCIQSKAKCLCHATASFDRNLHTQVSGGYSVLSTIFLWGSHSGHYIFCYVMTHYDITIGNGVASNVHCDIIMGHDVAMGTYHDVTMHMDVARTLIYYVLLCTSIFLSS